MVRLRKTHALAKKLKSQDPSKMHQSLVVPLQSEKSRINQRTLLSRETLPSRAPYHESEGPMNRSPFPSASSGPGAMTPSCWLLVSAWLPLGCLPAPLTPKTKGAPERCREVNPGFLLHWETSTMHGLRVDGRDAATGRDSTF